MDIIPWMSSRRSRWRVHSQSSSCCCLLTLQRSDVAYRRAASWCVSTETTFKNMKSEQIYWNRSAPSQFMVFARLWIYGAYDSRIHPRCRFRRRGGRRNDSITRIANRNLRLLVASERASSNLCFATVLILTLYAWASAWTTQIDSQAGRFHHF